jgi:Lar family restriction alleviation protein
MRIDSCPFCGNDDPYWEESRKEGAETLVFLVCGECGAEGPFVTNNHAEAARLWNTRERA